jgi:multiple sugar transport system ATP-binding protein
MTEITLEGLTKVYDDAQGTETAVDGIDLTLADGEFVTLVGPSGCGKSTTLEMLAGLVDVTDGRILFDGEDVTDLKPSEREVALAFQNYALYPKMTARENMEYGLKHAANMPKAEREGKVRDIAELLDITDVLDDLPSEMSGGQKQRVALGRAIVRNPTIFLLDEPLSNLDAKLRSRMRRELQRIQEQLDITTLYVTHDQKEAMTMGDRVAVMRDGTIQQVAKPDEAYDNPANEFVAGFLGSPSMNRLSVSVQGESGATALTREGRTLVRLPDGDALTGRESVVIGIRPEDVALFDDPEDGAVPGEVLNVEYQGNVNFIHLEYGAESITARSSLDFTPDPGTSVGIAFPPEETYVFDGENGDTIWSARTDQRTTPSPRE